MQKEACCIIVDVGESMGQIIAGSSTGLDNAKHAIRLMIQQKLLFTKQDELAIILVGTEHTANALNEQQPDAYLHVSVLQSMSKPTLQLLELIDTIDPQPSSGDVIDGLLVAMEMIHTRVKKLKFSKRIFLITDGAGTIVDDPEAFQQICDGLREGGFKLNIIGVNFEQLDDDDEEEKEEEKHEHIKNAVGRSAIQLSNERLLRSLAREVGGVVFNVRHAIDMLSVFRSKSIHQVTKFRGDLQIGNEIQIPCYAYTATQLQNMPTLKKLSALAQEAVNPETMAVRMERSYWNTAAQDAKSSEVSDSMRIRSYRYGHEQVPISEEDAEALKMETERGIQVLSFVAQQKINRFQVLSSVDCIVAEPGNVDAERALSAFIHALYETQKVAIVRYVKRKNAPPLLGVLYPVVKTDYECLYWNQLPFAEDIREYSFASLNANRAHVPNAAQLDAARQLIRSMNLMDASVDEDGDLMEALHPKYTFNPCLQRFYQLVERRALDPSAPVEPLEPIIAKYMLPDASLVRRAAPAIQQFQHAFPLTKQEKVDKKNVRHWRDYYENIATTDTDLEQLKKARMNEGNGGDNTSGGRDNEAHVELKLEDVMSTRVDKVGSVDPVADFKAIMSRRDDARIIVSGMREMLDRIRELVIHSFSTTQYPRAILCLRTLREGCVQHEEAQLFNDGLTSLRALFEAKYPVFWQLMVQEQILPINSEEVPAATVTPQQAAQFYVGTSSVEPVPCPVAEKADTDELFDSME